MDVVLFAVTACMYRYYLTSTAAASPGTPFARPSWLRGSSTTTTTAESSLLTSDTATATSLTYDVLQQQNAATSNAVLHRLSADPAFVRLAEYEGDLTHRRDAEDDEKLRQGIQYAQDKGVLDPHFTPEPYVDLDVVGKTPEQVARIIVHDVEQAKQSGTVESEGGVIVLVGLSGTGKGTTVAELCRILQEEQGHTVVTWSNGNVFRSVTLLATTWCQQNYPPSDDEKGVASVREEALTKDNLASFMNMLSFDEFQNQYDIRIQGLGLDTYVSQIANTQLKSPVVSQNIPTVAQYTQGEVIAFAAKAVERMQRDGCFVLLEGRAQTVDYVRSPFRFNLTLSDGRLIGQRRAAQRVMAETWHRLQKDGSNVNPAEIEKTLLQVLHEMVQGI
jgi:energy-coupling factor transporter ATP-binding protein EcfA2